VRVRVQYTEDVDDYYRRALWWEGHPGEWPDHKDPRKCPMATREDVRDQLWAQGADNDMADSFVRDYEDTINHWDWEQQQEEEEE
jgi:hypothetical protein